MSKANRPAFPNHPDNSQSRYSEWREGITIRDYFAAKAMQALLTTAPEKIYKTDYLKDISKLDDNQLFETAYYYADGMMKAREKK